MILLNSLTLWEALIFIDVSIIKTVKLLFVLYLFGTSFKYWSERKDGTRTLLVTIRHSIYCIAGAGLTV